MKFNLPNPQPLPDTNLKLRVGNVYPAKGGKGDTKYWVVLAIRNDAVHMIGLDKDGAITKAQSYGAHVFDGSSWAFNRNLSLLGHCPEVENFEMTVNWLHNEDGL